MDASKKSSCFLIIMICLALVSSSESSKKALRQSEETAYFRLPGNIFPTHYDIYLKPNVTLETFMGRVGISIYVASPVKTIVLHCNNLDIGIISLKDQNSLNVQITNRLITADTREFLIIDLANEIGPGHYYLRVEYIGHLANSRTGLYSTTLDDGEIMIASAFEPIFARHAFPCFDEPAFKAAFEITLEKPAKLVALSNMEATVKSIDKDKKYETVTFAKTFPMPTYLVSFVISNFAYKQQVINARGIGKNFIIRAFAKKQDIIDNKVRLVLDLAQRAIEFYLQYFEVPYPLSKLDMICIPGLDRGAMETWGLITFNQLGILLDPHEASSADQVEVAHVVAHQLAHMWFGNLVTMKWWDEHWLNEGFNTFMEFKAVNAIEPTWRGLNIHAFFMHPILARDSGLASYSVKQPVEVPNQIYAMYDSMVYSKASFIIRMIEDVTGPDHFRKAVTDYLNRNKYANTVAKDFIDCLQVYFKIKNPNLDIAYIMDTWTKPKGYPLLTVTEGDQPNTYYVRQKRFVSETLNETPVNSRWFVPITYTTSKKRYDNILWFSDKVDEVKITLGEDEKWLKLNNDQLYYYRVTYSLQMWEIFTQELKLKGMKTNLTPSDRAHLLNDVFALANAMMVPYGTALDLSTYLYEEEALLPWGTAAYIFMGLSKKMQNSMEQTDLHERIQLLIMAIYKNQTWERPSENVHQGFLRATIFELALFVELAEAEQQARDIMLRWIDLYNTPHKFHIMPDLRHIVYHYGMRHTTMDEWEHLWIIYVVETDVVTKKLLRDALAAPRDTEILRKYLYLAWVEHHVHREDYLLVVIAISANPSGTALIWDHVRQNWSQLADRYGKATLGRLVGQITSGFDTELKLGEMEAFFKRFPKEDAGAEAMNQALEVVRKNILWTNTHVPIISAWLRDNRVGISYNYGFIYNFK